MTVAVKGVNYTKVDDPKAANILPMGEWGGKVRVQMDEYTSDATETVGSTIAVGKLPVGARFLGAIIFHEAFAVGSIELGDENDPNRYMEAITLQAAAIVHTWDSDLVPGSQGSYEVVGAANTSDGKDDQELILTVSAGTLTTTCDFMIIIFYTQE